MGYEAIETPPADTVRASPGPKTQQIEALAWHLSSTESELQARERLLNKANAHQAKAAAQRDVYREMAGLRAAEVARLREQNKRLEAALAERDSLIESLVVEVRRARARATSLERAKSGLTLALAERNRLTADKLHRLRAQFERLRDALRVDDLELAADAERKKTEASLAALARCSWADEAGSDR